MKSRGNYKGNNINIFDKNGKIEKSKPNPNTKVMLSVFMNMRSQAMSPRDRVFVEDMIAILERLDWYESQDLIRREDAKKVLYDRFGRLLITDYIDKVPKAEPSCKDVEKTHEAEPTISNTSNALERVGDCETCKHYGTDICSAKCAWDSEYEPYTSKE